MLLGPIAAPFIRRAGAAGPTIRIGVVNSMSGGLAAYAQEGQPAFEHIIKKINAEGGIKSKGGAKIELVLADDTSQPARTAAEARRLITEEKVQLLTGTILSAQMLALTPVLDKLKMPTLSVWAGGSQSNYMFTLGYPYDRGYAQTINDFIVSLRDDSKFPIKTAVMGYSNYEAGQQVNEFLTEKLKASGIEIIGEAALDIRAQDQTAAMVRIRSLKPDVVAGLVTPRDGILLHQAHYNLNYHGSLFCGGTGGYTDLSLWKDLGPEIGKAVLTRNLFGMTGFSAGAKIDSMQKIVAELRDVAKLDRIGQGAIQYAQAARVLRSRCLRMPPPCKKTRCSRPSRRSTSRSAIPTSMLPNRRACSSGRPVTGRVGDVHPVDARSGPAGRLPEGICPSGAAAPRLRGYIGLS